MAVELWRDAASTRQVYAFVELAKYYKHRVRDYAQAEEQTRAALAIVTARDFSPDARAVAEGIGASPRAAGIEKQVGTVFNRAQRLATENAGPSPEIGEW